MADYESYNPSFRSMKHLPPDVINQRGVDDIVKEGSNPSAKTYFKNRARIDDDGGSDLMPSRINRILKKGID